MKQQNQKAVKKLTAVAMLTALAVALQFIEFPIPIMPPFIKLDFSDLPGLVGAIMFGPLAGIVIQLLKNVIHFASSNSMFIGEISNFFLGAAFAGTAGIVYKKISGIKGVVIGGIIGAVVSGIVALPLNLYIIYPLYYKAALPHDAILQMYQTLLPSIKSMAQAIFVFNVPFTIIKNLISVIVAAAIYKPITQVQRMMK